MYYLFLTTIIVGVVTAYNKNFTTIVDAGQAGCFFHKVLVDEVVYFEYTVINSTLGDLNVNFQIADPDDHVIVEDYQKSENEHRYTAIDEGTYRFCFDNTLTNFNVITISFYIHIRLEDDDHDIDNDEMKPLDNTEDAYMRQLQDICESISRVQENLLTAQRLQALQSRRKVKDWHLVEELRDRVTNWSKSLIILMVLIGITQVTLVKSLFKDRAEVLNKLELNVSTTNDE